MGTNAEVILRPTSGAVSGPEAGTSQSDAGGTEMTRTAELGTSALEAQARAMVQARFWVAKQPGMTRVWDHVEQRLLRECKRPGFANASWFILPIGNDSAKYPAGFTIRFAEAALRMCGNIDVEQMVISDDPYKRTVRVRILDLETNFAYTTEVVVDKTVERNNPKDREVISYRQNSQGKQTYVVAATEQEVAMKQGSAVSKAIRTQGLRMIPGDILDECKKLVLYTRKEGLNKEDPETARKLILDNFVELGVSAADIAKYLEHDTDHFLPAEREVMRGVYSAIRDGHVTWKDVMDAKFGAGGNEDSEGTKKLKDVLEKRKSASTPPPPGQTTPQAATKQADPGDSMPPVTSGTTPQPSTPTQQSTNAPAASQAHVDAPPAGLPDLQDFPETSEPAWVQVKGVVYKLYDTGYRKWEPAQPAAKKGRKELDFGS